MSDFVDSACVIDSIYTDDANRKSSSCKPYS